MTVRCEPASSSTQYPENSIVVNRPDGSSSIDTPKFRHACRSTVRFPWWTTTWVKERPTTNPFWTLYARPEQGTTTRRSRLVRVKQNGAIMFDLVPIESHTHTPLDTLRCNYHGPFLGCVRLRTVRLDSAVRLRLRCDALFGVGALHRVVVVTMKSRTRARINQGCHYLGVHTRHMLAPTFLTFVAGGPYHTWSKSFCAGDTLGPV